MTGVLNSLLGFTGKPKEVNEQMFTTPGTYSWIAPPCVTSVAVVAVGGGGQGAFQYGGGGGGLGWRNAISVTPGNSYGVTVGGANSDSVFIDTTTGARGGGATSINPCNNCRRTGGTYNGGGGGNGGLGGVIGCTWPGGGGAGGYSGNGGNGGTNLSGQTDGAGGGGGGAAAYSGGGVGIFGQGANGAKGCYTTCYFGQGGSGGLAGWNSAKPLYGGGFAAGWGGPGAGTGAVRIVWNALGRGVPSFPSTNVGPQA